MVTGQSGLCALSQDQGQCMSSPITSSVRQESAQLTLCLGSEKTKSSKGSSRSCVRVKPGTEPCSHEYSFFYSGQIFFLLQWPEQQTGHLLHVSLGQLGGPLELHVGWDRGLTWAQVETVPQAMKQVSAGRGRRGDADHAPHTAFPSLTVNPV